MCMFCYRCRAGLPVDYWIIIKPPDMTAFLYADDKFPRLRRFKRLRHGDDLGFNSPRFGAFARTINAALHQHSYADYNFQSPNTGTCNRKG